MAALPCQWESSNHKASTVANHRLSNRLPCRWEATPKSRGDSDSFDATLRPPVLRDPPTHSTPRRIIAQPGVSVADVSSSNTNRKDGQVSEQRSSWAQSNHDASDASPIWGTQTDTRNSIGQPCGLFVNFHEETPARGRKRGRADSYDRDSIEKQTGLEGESKNWFISALSKFPILGSLISPGSKTKSSSPSPPQQREQMQAHRVLERVPPVSVQTRPEPIPVQTAFEVEQIPVKGPAHIKQDTNTYQSPSDEEREIESVNRMRERYGLPRCEVMSSAVIGSKRARLNGMTRMEGRQLWDPLTNMENIIFSPPDQRSLPFQSVPSSLYGWGSHAAASNAIDRVARRQSSALLKKRGWSAAEHRRRLKQAKFHPCKWIDYFDYVKAKEAEEADRVLFSGVAFPGASQTGQPSVKRQPIDSVSLAEKRPSSRTLSRPSVGYTKESLPAELSSPPLVASKNLSRGAVIVEFPRTEKVDEETIAPDAAPIAPSPLPKKQNEDSIETLNLPTHKAHHKKLPEGKEQVDDLHDTPVKGAAVGEEVVVTKKAQPLVEESIHVEKKSSSTQNIANEVQGVEETEKPTPLPWWLANVGKSLQVSVSEENVFAEGADDELPDKSQPAPLDEAQLTLKLPAPLFSSPTKSQTSEVVQSQNVSSFAFGTPGLETGVESEKTRAGGAETPKFLFGASSAASPPMEKAVASATSLFKFGSAVVESSKPSSSTFSFSGPLTENITPEDSNKKDVGAKASSLSLGPLFSETKQPPRSGPFGVDTLKGSLVGTTVEATTPSGQVTTGDGPFGRANASSAPVFTFGAPKSAESSYTQPATPSLFETSKPEQPTSIFGSTSPAIFGQPSSVEKPTLSLFSAPTAPDTLSRPLAESNSTEMTNGNEMTNDTPFGQDTNQTTSLFGQNDSTNLFSQNKPVASNLLGQSKPEASNLFGQSKPEASNLFGQTKPDAGNLFGQSKPEAGNLFGQSKPEASNLFGQTKPDAGNLFGQSKPDAGNLFGQSKPDAGNLFGQSKADAGNLFGQSKPDAGNLFGQSKPEASNLFGQSKPDASNPFGQNKADSTSLFGQQQPATTAPLFGESKAVVGGLFGQPITQGSLFGSTPAASGLFSQKPAEATGNNVFGQNSAIVTQPQTTTLFGSAAVPVSSSFGNTPMSGGLFGNTTPQQSNVFGSVPQTEAQPNLFSSQSTNIFGTTPAPGQALGPAGAAFGPAGTVFGSTTGNAFTFGANPSSQESNVSSTNPFVGNMTGLGGARRPKIRLKRSNL